MSPQPQKPPTRTDDPQRQPDDGYGAALDERPATKRPRLYRVLLHNDDYTTRDFVVGLLMELFHKPFAEATAIMLHVHTRGIGVCGVYTREIAETKVQQTMDAARSAGMPLLCTMEPDDDA